VAVFEHREEVVRQRNVAGESLGHERIDSHQPEWDMDAGPPAPPHALQALPELVPGDGIRAAELEGPAGRSLEVDRAREVFPDVVEPDRLNPLPAGADDRRHGREPCKTYEGRQDPPVTAEDEARPEDDVRDPGRRDELLVRPLRPKVRDEILRRLARPESTHVDEAV